MTKARDLGNLLGGGGAGVPSFSGTGAIDVPAGTTAQRPANPNTGYIRFNTTIDQLEQYTSDSGWQGISPPPVYTGTDVTNIEESDATQTIVITGSNFDTTASAVLIDANGVIKTPTTVTRNSSTQLTMVFSGGDVLTSAVPDPLSIRVTNGSGLATTADDVLTIDAQPIWSTSSGSLATVTVGQAISPITLSASDPEGGTVSYSVSSGGLPPGLSLSSSGSITGTPTNTDYATAGPVQTNYFNVDASDGTGNTTNRAFAIIRQWLDGSTSALAARSVHEIYTNTGGGATGSTIEPYYLDPTGSGSAFQVHGVEQLSDLGTIPSGTTAHFKNLRGLNVVTYNNFDQESPNLDQYLLSYSQFNTLVEGLYAQRAAGWTGSIYWAVFINGTLELVTRTHFNTTHQQWIDGHGNEVSEDFSAHGVTPELAKTEYMAQRAYWDVWDTNYTLVNYNGLIRAIPYRSSASIMGEYGTYSSVSIGLHYKRLNNGEHYPWRGDGGGVYPSTDYMTSGGYRFGDNTLTASEAISAGVISTGSHYSTTGGAPATKKGFNNAPSADDYAGQQIKQYIFVHEGG